MLLGAEKWGLHVYAILAPSFVGQFDCTPGQMAAALKEMGFYDVAEVALGADLTAQAEAAEFEEREGGPIRQHALGHLQQGQLALLDAAARHGPGLHGAAPLLEALAFVERHMPEQVPLVSTTPSPMVMLGRNIKDRVLASTELPRSLRPWATAAATPPPAAKARP